MTPLRHRLFLAVVLPDAWRRPLAAAGREAARVHGGRATEEGNLHVTVAFLGAVGDKDMAGLVSGLSSAIGKVPSFNLRSSRLAWGPPGGEPRMLWAAWDSEGALDRLATGIYRLAAVVTEMAPPRGPMTPHATLARFRLPVPPGARPPILPVLPDSLDVAEISLLDSDLAPDGPQYMTLETFKLK